MDGSVDFLKALTRNSRHVEVQPGQVDAHFTLSGRTTDHRVDLVTAPTKCPDESAADEAAGAGHDDPHL
jgi:hypothetical protein